MRFAATLEFLRAIDYDFPAWTRSTWRRWNLRSAPPTPSPRRTCAVHRLREVAERLALSPGAIGDTRREWSAASVRQCRMPHRRRQRSEQVRGSESQSMSSGSTVLSSAQLNAHARQIATHSVGELPSVTRTWWMTPSKSCAYSWRRSAVIDLSTSSRLAKGQGKPIQLSFGGLPSRKDAEVDDDAPVLGERDGELIVTATERVFPSPW